MAGRWTLPGLWGVQTRRPPGPIPGALLGILPVLTGGEAGLGCWVSTELSLPVELSLCQVGQDWARLRRGNTAGY